MNTLPYRDTFLFQVNSLVRTNCLGKSFKVSALKPIYMKGNVFKMKNIWNQVGAMKISLVI